MLPTHTAGSLHGLAMLRVEKGLCGTLASCVPFRPPAKPEGIHGLNGPEIKLNCAAPANSRSLGWFPPVFPAESSDRNPD